MIGSAAKVYECTFDSNMAVANSTSQATPFLGYGGAVNIQTGSSVDCKTSLFLSNSADVGGAVFVRDGSFEGENLNFARNAVQPGGVGGAVAVEISRGKAVLSSANRLRNIVFQCDSCDFRKNNGSLAGGQPTCFSLMLNQDVYPGALHVHDMDPGATFGADNELTIEGCTFEGRNAFRMQDKRLTCPSYFRYVDIIHDRSVLLRNTRFVKNLASAGGAIFTNNLTMINIVPHFLQERKSTWRLDYVLEKNETHLDACNVSFYKNRIIDNGYGERVATTPFTAFLVNLDGDVDDEGRQVPRKTFSNGSFLSGDRLRFDVVFRDGLSEPVSFAENLTAYISCHEESVEEERSNCDQLEIAGQEVALVNEDGTLSFTDARLRGLRDQTYVLRVDYSATTELQTLNVKPSFVYVTMRPCIVGETTVIKQGQYLACQECSSSTYNLDPEGAECKPCPENAQCESRVITPNDGYWHASPCSERIQGCLTSHACAFEGRSENLRDMADDMTSCDVDTVEIDEYQKAQCTEASSF